MTCGTVRNNINVPADQRWTLGMADIDGIIPGTGRVDQSGSVSGYHHPSWHIDQIGNVFGIAINPTNGEVFLTASSNYGAGYFGQTAILQYGTIEGGGHDSVTAAGRVYKLDAITGQATVFAELPQQSTTVTHVDCEVTSETNVRTTGVGLGNIAYDVDNDQYFVSNIEDGRIYRLDRNGNILDSYDPLTYDDGAAGITDIEDLAYGLAVEPGAARLFFGTIDATSGSGGAPSVYSIQLSGSGSFQGTINNTNMPAGATWNNYVPNGSFPDTLHTTIPTQGGSTFIDVTEDYHISDLQFDPNGNLLVGIRVGCDGNFHTSYNHEGETNILTPTGGIYNTVAEMDISVTGSAANEDSYGGVAFYELSGGDVHYVISSSDILTEAGPHGLAIFEDDDAADTPISPLAAISYGGVDTSDPKGVGGDVEVFSAPVNVNDLGVGNLVFFDNNGDGNYDASVDAPAPNVTVELYNAGDTPGTDLPVANATTGAGGCYRLSVLTNGNYFAHIPAHEFQAGGDLENYFSSYGNGTDTQTDDTGTGGDENGVDATNPAATGISSTTINLSRNNEPLNAAETGKDGTGDSQDNDYDFTIDFGFIQAGFGNRVWSDTDGDGIQDAGEAGISGVTLTLHTSGGSAVLCAPDPVVTLTHADNFDPTANYSGSDVSGSLWDSNSWTETDGAGAGPGSGDVQVVSDVDGNAVRIQEDGTIERAISLAGCAPGSTTLDFDVRFDNTENTDELFVEYHNGTSWVTGDPIAQLNGSNESATFQSINGLPIPDGATAIRFRWDAGGGNDTVYIDNVDIRCGILQTPVPVSTVTDSNGIYWFTAADCVVPSTAYEVRLDTTQGPLTGLVLTDQNAGGVTSNDPAADDTDSDASQSSNTASISLTSPATGSNPSYDFGFSPPCSVDSVVASNIQTQLNGPLASDDTFTFDVTVTATNGAATGWTSTNPNGGGLYSATVSYGPFLISGGAVTVTAEDNDDPACNDSVTVNPPTAPPTVGIGNLVFKDLNDNGVFDSGEGLDDVTVDLYVQGDTIGTPRATVQTASGGCYEFIGLNEGNYFIHIPASEFGTGQELSGHFSVTGNGIDDQTDDNSDENGVDDLNPATNGISSVVIALSSGNEPLNADESGKDGTGDSPDADLDYTVDFGFYVPLGVGNLVFQDVNNDGDYDSGIDSAIQNVTVELYNVGDTPGVDPTVDSAITDANGCYELTTNIAGNYFVHIPAAEFQAGGQLLNLLSVSGAGTDNGNDDSADENGIDDVNPAVNGISSVTINLSENNEPLNAAESGKDGTGDSQDNDFDYTIDFGFVSTTGTVGLGNLVFIDGDGNGVYTAGEGVDGVTVELYTSGGTAGASTPVATTTTHSGGCYLFAGLTPGTYFAHIPASEFGGSEPLNGQISLPGAGTDNDVDDNADENGVDNGDPATDGISSRDVTLTVGGEPTDAGSETGKDNTSDDGSDNNINLTVDFGFNGAAPTVGIGNLVFFDNNNDGRYVAAHGDTVIPNVLVELYNQGEDPNSTTASASTITLADGSYLFSGLAPGTYFVHIPASQFGGGQPLENLVSSVLVGTNETTDDNTDQNGSGATPATTGVSSNDYTLAVSGEPVDAGTETGVDASGDNPTDSNINLSADMGFTTTSTKPSTFAGFVAANGLTGPDAQPVPDGTGTGGNPDLDIDPNILEHAFCDDPEGGNRSHQGFCVRLTDPVTRQLEAFIVRPEGIQDVIYQFQGRDSLTGDGPDSNEWVTFATIPAGGTIAPPMTAVADGNGGETITFPDLASNVPFLTDDYGLVRVVVSLDADQNGVPDTLPSDGTVVSDNTETCGWQNTEYQVNECATSSWSFVTQPVFTGRIEGVSGNDLDFTVSSGGLDLSTLLSGGTYYIEVIDDPDGATNGDWEGHRYDVASGGTGSLTVVNDPNIFTASTDAGSPTIDSHNTQNGAPDAGLNGVTIALRRHYTLDDLLDKVNVFTGSDGFSPNDRILLYENRTETPGFRALVLLDNGSTVRWINEGDLINQVDQGGRVMDPVEGYFIHPRVATIDYIRTGEVRRHDVATPFTQDYNLAGSPWPADQSLAGPNGRGLTVARGIPGGIDPGQSTEVLIWEGDEGTYTESYLDYFLLHYNAPWQYWTDWTDLTLPNMNSENVLKAGRAAFIELPTGSNAIDFTAPEPQ
ncbi:MAG: SdrD B-like domain-containing protein [Verrucomicrobiota bacterium]